MNDKNMVVDCKISIKDIIGSNLALDADDGNRVRAQICKALDRGESVTVSLLGLKHIIALFLGSAIGQLYKSYSPDMVDSKVIVLTRDAKDEEWVEFIRDRARHYYHDPEFRKTLEDTFINEYATGPQKKS